MRIKNKKARFNYNVAKKIEAGIVLTGAEVKALRKNSADLSRSYAKIIGGELFLINANISGESVIDPTRSRKLLVHKKEIASLQTEIKAKSLTIIPLSLYNAGRLIKVKLGLAKPKKRFEKKASLKKADIERETERELRQKE